MMEALCVERTRDNVQGVVGVVISPEDPFVKSLQANHHAVVLPSIRQPVSNGDLLKHVVSVRVCGGMSHQVSRDRDNVIGTETTQWTQAHTSNIHAHMHIHKCKH